FFFFFFQAEDGIRVFLVTGVQTCALPISPGLLLLGLSRGEFMLAEGCVLRVSPLLPVTLPFALQPGRPGEGSASLVGTIPASATDRKSVVEGKRVALGCDQTSIKP